MEILVENLAKTFNYNLAYFFKLLRENGISNRIILNEEDIKNLYLSVQVVNNKSYMLRIELKLICENSFEGVSL